MKNLQFFLSVILCTVVFDSAFSNNIQSNAEATRVNNAIAEIKFIFNQPKYAPGDTAFFKGYLFLKNAGKNNDKRIVNLKLIDATGHQMLFNRILFLNGFCSSQIIIPENITPTVYTIVAYLDDVKADSPDIDLLYESDFIIAGEKEFNGNSSFKKSDRDYQPNSLNVILTFDKTQYRTRDLVKATLSIKDLNNDPVKSNLTITVFQDNLFKGRNITDTSEAVSNINRNNAHNIQLLNDGNIEVKKSYPYYFKGRVVLENSKPAPDSTLITFYLNKEDFIYARYTNNKGEFEFPLFKNFGDDEIFYMISYRGKNQNDAKIILDNPQFEKELTMVEKLSTNDAYGNYAMIKKAILKSYMYYSVKAKDRDSSDKTDEIESDYVVDMEKYETFPTMIEVLGNIVQAVKYFKTKDRESVRVFLKSNGYYGKEDPIFIIDGIMTDNTEYFLSLDPSLVSKIRLLRSQATLNRYGALGKNGIIAVETKILNNTLSMPRTERSLFITGITSPIKFNPQLNWNESTPDLRSTLYWNPELLTDADHATDITFSTGDAVGKFKIKIEGFADDGTPIFYQTSFQVNYMP